ncbi:MAG: hypothetical protein LAO24_12380 [Acidobacteriia bacterium]|nr:hypothetical protein [Terriglobia bacterium]
MRPRGLKETTIAMAVLNLTGFAYVQWDSRTARLQLAFNIVMMAAGYFVLWFYWKGRNWARILILLTSLLGLFNLVALPHWRIVAQSGIMAEAVLSLFLIYWLNSPRVRDFFKYQAEPHKGSAWE